MPAVASFPTVSLYVGDLDPSVSENHILETFQQNPDFVGTIMTAIICRDVINKHSLGYGYINFRTAEDAERALDTMNYQLINGHPMRLMWSQRDPAIRRSGVGNVFVKNLERTIDNRILRDTFSAYGNILSCKVAMDENNQSKGYGFVHFETKEEAERTIEAVNGMELNGQQVYVGPFIPRSQRIKADDFTNIYIKNFEDMTNENLRNIFERFGPITSCTIMTDGNGTCKGFGFVAFQNSEDGKRAVEEMHGHELTEGKPLYVARAQKKIERQVELKTKHQAMQLERRIRTAGSNLYVKNLEDGVDDEALRKKFEPYGTITSAKVMKDENGRSKCFGFVCYSAPTEATKAVSHLNGTGTKPLYVALAQPKEARQLHLLAQNQARMAQLFSAQYIDQQRMQFYGPASQMSLTNPRSAGQEATGRPAVPQNVTNGNGAVPRQYSNGNGAGLGAVPRHYPNGAVSYYQSHNGTVPHYAVNYTVPSYGYAGWNFPTYGAGNFVVPQINQTASVPAAGQSNNARINRRCRTRGRPVMEHAQPTAASSRSVPQPHQLDQAVQVQSPAPLTTSMLASAEPEQQKQILGERLHPMVATMAPENLVGKVVGMLLEMESAELVHLIENVDILRLRVQEAVELLTGSQNPAPVDEDRSQRPTDE